MAQKSTTVSWLLLSLLLLVARWSCASAAPTPWGDISRALVVIAHPDDAETICGGTVAMLIDVYNVSVAYVVTTNGDKGWSKDTNKTSPEIAAIRRAEQAAAARVMGVSQVYFLDQEDGRTEAVDPIALKLNITIAIRSWRPDVVLTFDSRSDLGAYRFGVVHRDHQTVGRVAMDAVYPASRDYLAFPQIWPALPTWDTPRVWLFSFEQVSGADALVLPIAPAAFAKKLAALLEHRSQYGDAAEVKASLVTLGGAIASRNGLDPDTLAEAFVVVPIL
jgi:LmbE family N-acetylglucosaminyl deacetylase